MCVCLQRSPAQELNHNVLGAHCDVSLTPSTDVYDDVCLCARGGEGGRILNVYPGKTIPLCFPVSLYRGVLVYTCMNVGQCVFGESCR